MGEPMLVLSLSLFACPSPGDGAATGAAGQDSADSAAAADTADTAADTATDTADTAGGCGDGSEPLAAWSFDEGGGGTAFDAGPHGYDATLVGAGWTAEGLRGSALRLEADSAGYAELPVGALAVDGAFTVLGWARPAVLRGYNALLARGRADAIWNPYHLGYKDGGPLWATDNGGLGPSLHDLSSPGAHVGDWHLLAASYDPATGARVLYVDGAAVLADAEGPGALAYDDSPTRIGSDTNTGEPTGHFVGDLDEIVVLGCVVEPDFVLARWNAR